MENSTNETISSVVSRPVRLRGSGGALVLTIPIDFCLELQLKPGQYFQFIYDLESKKIELSPMGLYTGTVKSDVSFPRKGRGRVQQIVDDMIKQQDFEKDVYADRLQKIARGEIKPTNLRELEFSFRDPHKAHDVPDIIDLTCQLCLKEIHDMHSSRGLTKPHIPNCEYCDRQDHPQKYSS